MEYIPTFEKGGSSPLLKDEKYYFARGRLKLLILFKKDPTFMWGFLID